MESLSDVLCEQVCGYLDTPARCSLSVSDKFLERRLRGSLLFIREGNKQKQEARLRLASRESFKKFCRETRKFLNEHEPGY